MLYLYIFFLLYCPDCLTSQSLAVSCKVQFMAVSANCQGFGLMEKRVDVLNYLKGKQCQIYCLQDTHTTKASESFFRSQWNSECIFSSGTSNSRDVAILFSKNLEYKIHNNISDPEGNFIIGEISVEQNRFTLVNLYGPNQDTPIFLCPATRKWRGIMLYPSKF